MPVARDNQINMSNSNKLREIPECYTNYSVVVVKLTPLLRGGRFEAWHDSFL